MTTTAILTRIQAQAAAEAIRVTQHAQMEMDDEEITLDETLAAVANSQIIENYPDHRRGACCLLFGYTPASRPLHVVCSTSEPLLVIITVYEPMPPKWISPTQRRPR